MPYSYVGCYADKYNVGGRAFPNILHWNKQVSVNDCYEHAKKNNAKYFGLQYWMGDKNKTTGQCFYGSNDDYNRYGKPDRYTNGVLTNDCIKADGLLMGQGGSNAVYRIKY